jgi:hypothetical protein
MDQDALPGMTPKRARYRPGRVERQVDADLRAARRAGTLPDHTTGLDTLLRSLARQLDVAERHAVDDGKPVYVAPMVAQRMAETYAQLGLTGGQGGGDDADAWLAGIGAATVPHGT